MALKKCSKNNRKGFKWGDNGTCYVYTSGNDRSRDMAKSRAINEAIEKGEIKELQNDEKEDTVVELKSADMELDEDLLISAVQRPAIEENFIYFNSNKNNDTDLELSEINYELSELNEEKRVITGPAMIPNRSIERLSEDGERYFVYFSENTVNELSQRLISNCNINTKVEHEMDVDDVHLCESWIVEDPDNDKANAYGFDSSNITKGTWMVSYKCNNEDFWNKVKEGDVAGFSVEGYFIEHFKDHFKSDCKECEKEKEEDEDVIPQEELDRVYKVLRSMLND